MHYSLQHSTSDQYITANHHCAYLPQIAAFPYASAGIQDIVIVSWIGTALASRSTPSEVQMRTLRARLTASQLDGQPLPDGQTSRSM